VGWQWISGDDDMDDFVLDEGLQELWQNLTLLHEKLRDHTNLTYKRVNPFAEDLFKWKEKGEFLGYRDVTIYDSTTVVGDVHIGDHTWIGPFCSLDGNGGLEIGSHCAISAGVQILTHDTVKWALSGGKHQYEYSKVRVGDCCFVGTGAVILRGVTIGKHCLIGANAVVNIDLPDYSIAAGIPAKVIGKVTVEDGNVQLEYFR
jgi:acetyltransferase-like isoleucine patch superfamily enzyme